VITNGSVDHKRIFRLAVQPPQGLIRAVDQEAAAAMTVMLKPKSWRVSDWLIAFGLTLAAVPFALAQQSPKNFVIDDESKPVAAIRFDDSQGQARSLADFRGKVVLLNIWATWCVPCRKEMPALDHLEAILGGAKFTVVTISVDRIGIEAVARFFEEVGVQRLPVYADGSGKALRALRAIGLPTSVIIDREGREVGRVTGPAEWDSGATIEFLRGVISQR
jgi:thiol-disulfide isomerase/thioredoxin